MKHIYSIILNLLLIASLITMYKCNNLINNKLKIDLEKEKNNTSVLSGKVETFKNENQRIIFERGVLLTDKKDLEKYNKRLFDEINKLKGIKPNTVINSINKVDIDTFKLISSISKNTDTTYTIDFSHDTMYTQYDGRSLKGILDLLVKKDTININRFLITQDILKIKKTIIIGEKDNQIKVWISSEFPGFSSEEIDAVILSEKMYPFLKKLNNKKFSVGPYIGISYDSKTIVRPNIGIGLQYNLLKF
jgi:hypothetical protein